jgi:hypothetical protein
MRRVLLLSLLAATVLLYCSEKCAFEPCGPESGYLCGVVVPPAGFSLVPSNLAVGTVTNSGRLHCDWSFSIPTSQVCGARIVVLAAEDTIPVMLGYSLPVLETGVPNHAGLPASEQGLMGIVGSPDSGVRISSASTALALTMVSPLFGGATDGERAWFASQVIADEGYPGLVDEIAEALKSFPKTYLDGETCPGIYIRVSEIISRIVAEIDRGEDNGSPGESPQVTDVSGDAIKLSNPGFIHYGVRISDAAADTARAAFLLRKREVSSLVIPEPPFTNTYNLGDGCFDVQFFKGLTGFDPGHLVDPQHPAGLATLANVGQATWNVVTIFATLPGLQDPGSSPLTSMECIGPIAEAAEAQDVSEIIQEVAGCCCRHADDTAGWLFGEEVNPADFARFIRSAKPVLINSLVSCQSAGGDVEDLFSADLVAAPEYKILCVCQQDGVMSPCPDKPALSGGTVLPSSGGLDTEFTFSVHYFDELADPPSMLQVLIDHEPHDMNLVSGERDDGTYDYATRLSPGDHTYFFTCSDTTGATARLPSRGSTNGPFVSTPPVLAEGRVRPSTGDNATSFRYSVEYSDADGQRPASIRVFIDDDAHNLPLWYWDRDHGVYMYATKLSSGVHTYYFVTVDPSGLECRLPGTGVQEGPVVSNAPELSRPQVRPPSGLPGTEFKFEVNYLDRDGDPPSYIHAYIDGAPSVMILKTGTASAGVYCCERTLRWVGYHEYYFLCVDLTGAAARLPISGAFKGPHVDTGGNRNPYAKVAVHVQAHDPTVSCSREFPPATGCAGVRATYADCSFDCFPVFFDLCEYRGIEFSLSWPDWTYSASWHSCADVSIGDIRKPGDGVAVGWNECHLVSAVIPGWAWMYADGPGLVCVSPHPASGVIGILDCYGGWSGPTYNFCAGVCGAEGEDP